MSAETALSLFLNNKSNICNSNAIHTVTRESRTTARGNISNSSNNEITERNINTAVSISDETRHNIKEQLEERAAIMEYDGGLPRKEAEKATLSSLRVYAYRLKENSEKEPVMITHNTDLEEAMRILDLKYGERLLMVTERKIGKEIFG